MKITPTDQEKEQGYRVCDCGSVELLQAGFDVATHSCSLCKLWIADSDEFFKTNDAIEVMSK